MIGMHFEPFVWVIAKNPFPHHHSTKSLRLNSPKRAPECAAKDPKTPQTLPLLPFPEILQLAVSNFLPETASIKGQLTSNNIKLPLGLSWINRTSRDPMQTIVRPSLVRFLHFESILLPRPNRSTSVLSLKKWTSVSVDVSMVRINQSSSPGSLLPHLSKQNAHLTACCSTEKNVMKGVARLLLQSK